MTPRYPPRRPIESSGASSFDRNVIKQVASEFGHDVRLCKQVVVHEANPDRGLPRKVKWVCTSEITAYVGIDSMKQVKINTPGTGTGGTGSIIRGSETILNIVPDGNFDESKITKDHRAYYRGAFYQMELIDDDSSMSHGDVMLYQYRLNNPTKEVFSDRGQEPQMIAAKKFFR
jgi:hypothetical protein